MSDSLDRWKKAQESEKVHPAHGGGYWGIEVTKERLQKFDKEVEDLHGAKILEVGSGTGLVHDLDFECKSFGIDPLSHDISEELADSSAEVLTGVGEHLPFKNDHFDLVISYNVLDHCINPEAVMEECRRVIKEGGDFLFEINTYEVPNTIHKLMDRVDVEHPHHFSQADIKQLLQNAKFEQIHEYSESRHDFIYDLSIKKAVGLLCRMRMFYTVARPI